MTYQGIIGHNVGIMGAAEDFADDAYQCGLHDDAVGPRMWCLPIGEAANDDGDWVETAIEAMSLAD